MLVCMHVCMCVYVFCYQNEEFGLNDMSTSAFESGVDSTYALPVPVDPSVYLGNYSKGPDHPTYFAKGVYENDNTVGGELHYFTNGILENVNVLVM